MKEILELRINMDFAHLLFSEDEGKELGTSVKLVRIDTSTPMYEKVRETSKMVEEKYNRLFFFGWEYIRQYSDEEIRDSQFFQILPKLFTIAGEECGTKYDDSFACPICGSGAKMITPLKIRRSRIPKTDISMTLGQGEEILVSEKFKEIMEKHQVTGMRFEPVYSGSEKIDYFQLLPDNYIDFSEKSVFGIRPFNLANKGESFTCIHTKSDGTMEKEFVPTRFYKCPNGDNAGLNILSEAFLRYSPLIEGLDYFASRQTVGYKEKGLIRPRHLLFCSNRIMKIVRAEKLKGFRFEVAHIEKL